MAAAYGHAATAGQHTYAVRSVMALVQHARKLGWLAFPAFSLMSKGRARFCRAFPCFNFHLWSSEASG